MKKKRFYNNKKRNQKWTEQQKGRKIDFADKYIDTGHDKYTPRKKSSKPVFTRERARRFLKYLIVAVGCFCIISVGYGIMDFYIGMNAMPQTQSSADAGEADISEISIDIRSGRVQPVALDNGVMLDAVIDELSADGYSAVAFDIKRDDGTIGYESSLATVKAYSSETSGAKQLQASVSKLMENDILPVGRISCYKDDMASAGDTKYGITVNGKLYRDANGDAYLDPDSDAVYEYISSIIEETSRMGISVFVLDNYDLPDDIADNYNDGFETLARKLQNDFGSDIKLFKGVSVSVELDLETENTTESDGSAEADDAEIERALEDLFENTDDDTVYIVNTNSAYADDVKNFLDNNGGINYIISQQD